MPFKITITETKTIKKTVGRDYVKVGQKEVARDNSFFPRPEDPRTVILDEYGYSPQIEKEVEVTTDILTQQVETLDLAAVIKAINKLT